jgi:hypothetical protein
MTGSPGTSRLIARVTILLCAAALVPAAHAQAIRDLPGFRAKHLQPTDDKPSASAPIGFTVNFFGRTYSNLFVNNNGNITFEGPLETWVPFGLAHTDTPIIAPFFGDVDTSHAPSETVSYGNDRVDGHTAFGVDYFRVGYFDGHTDKLNTFQLILIDRSDTGPGNFDIEFNYKQLLWDIGDASHGVAAVAGFSNGTGSAGAIFELPGSMTNGAFLDNGTKSLVRGQLNSNVPGRYLFQARSGTVSLLRIVTPPHLPDGVAGRSWSTPPLQAEGGKAPYTWRAVNWPADLGLTLNPSTGVISGTPAHSGNFNLNVEVSDSVRTAPASQIFTLTVGGIGNSFSVYLIEPSHASVDTPVKLVAGFRPSSPGPATIQGTIEGAAVPFTDGGDGRYTANYTFHNSGSIPVDLKASLAGGELTGQGHVEVEGSFVYRGGPLEIDLGTLREGSESCRPLVLAAEQRGAVPFRVGLLRDAPAEHTLELRDGSKTEAAGGSPIMVSPADRLEVCLVTGKRAPSSQASGEPWLRLTVGSGTQTVDLKLRWKVNGLTFWQRWAWLFGLILLLLLAAFIVYGYIKPYRFSRGMALTFVPEYDELDQSPQPVSQWRGVHIGFYRNARACLHPSYRITGKTGGALAVLTATADGFSVAPGDGMTLSREMEVAEWREIPASGSSGRRGAIYRVGERGPFFRVVNRG